MIIASIYFPVNISWNWQGCKPKPEVGFLIINQRNYRHFSVIIVQFTSGTCSTWTGSWPEDDRKWFGFSPFLHKDKIGESRNELSNWINGECNAEVEETCGVEDAHWGLRCANKAARFYFPGTFYFLSSFLSFSLYVSMSLCRRITRDRRHHRYWSFIGIRLVRMEREPEVASSGLISISIIWSITFLKGWRYQCPQLVLTHIDTEPEVKSSAFAYEIMNMAVYVCEIKELESFD